MSFNRKMIEEDDMKRRRTRTDEERKMKDLTEGREMEREIGTETETGDTGKHWLFSSLKKTQKTSLTLHH